LLLLELLAFQRPTLATPIGYPCDKFFGKARGAMSGPGPGRRYWPPALAAGFRGTPVAEEDAPARRSPPRLARVGYRSKSRRGSRREPVAEPPLTPAVRDDGENGNTAVQSKGERDGEGREQDQKGEPTT
jgi:hypothetical protein